LGGSLYVVVYPGGSKSFEFRYKRQGKVRSIIIGNFPEIGLPTARKNRDALSAGLAHGRDPLDQRRIAVEEQRAKLDKAKEAAAARRAAVVAKREVAKRQNLTFKKIAEEWIGSMEKHWTDDHGHQTVQSLQDHVYEHIGDKAIDSVTTGDVLHVIDRLLAEKKVETARRVRQRLDAVFEFAGVQHSVAINPVASAKREIGKRIKAANKTNPGSSFPCVPLAEVPHLLRAMRAYIGTPVTRSLLWFVALTACRTGEARYATWSEFYLEERAWSIPAARMKAGRAHVVPLSAPVVALLTELRGEAASGHFVFPHPRRGDRPASENAILYALAAIGFKERMSGHGFRHLFSTVANESGLWRKDVIEISLAHGDEDAIRAKYNHAQYWAERAKLMDWWADELARLEAGTTPKIVAFKNKA
jgi:integrase